MPTYDADRYYYRRCLYWKQIEWPTLQAIRHQD